MVWSPRRRTRPWWPSWKGMPSSRGMTSSVKYPSEIKRGTTKTAGVKAPRKTPAIPGSSFQNASSTCAKMARRRNSAACRYVGALDSAFKVEPWPTTIRVELQNSSVTMAMLRHLAVARKTARPGARQPCVPIHPEDMRAVIQRVSEAAVSIEGKVHASIGPGLLVLVAVEETDVPEDIEWLAGKIVRL